MGRNTCPIGRVKWPNCLGNVLAHWVVRPPCWLMCHLNLVIIQKRFILCNWPPGFIVCVWDERGSRAQGVEAMGQGLDQEAPQVIEASQNNLCRFFYIYLLHFFRVNHQWYFYQCLIFWIFWCHRRVSRSIRQRNRFWTPPVAFHVRLFIFTAYKS